MLPVIAIVGRPNVGKSTLFNCLTLSRNALVANVPGLTRDRNYGEGRLGSRPYLVVDTGGISGDEDEASIDGLMAGQSWQAMLDSDAIFFVVDARDGLTAVDENIAQRLRSIQKPVILVVNKTDGLDEDIACADFFALGLSAPIPIAASHKRGVRSLIEHLLTKLPQQDEQVESEEKSKHTSIAVVGRPNVGKSTLINRLLGEERLIVFDQAGTTRDSIYVPLSYRDKSYWLIDTAGVRRRARLKESVEKFSVIKTLQAIEQANVVILLIDATTNIVEQDLSLLGFVLESGRALIIAVNKWDGLSAKARDDIKNELNRRLTFIDFARIHFISALHGTGVGHLYDFVDEAHQSATRQLSTSDLTTVLRQAVHAHPPPTVHRRRIKLRYAHMGGHEPPLIVIHGNQTQSVPDDYRRYLIRCFRDAFNLVGTPIKIEFKTGENPFSGRKNKLTPRQMRKRKRLMSHHKGKK